jgi:hypothetical protein
MSSSSNHMVNRSLSPLLGSVAVPFAMSVRIVMVELPAVYELSTPKKSRSPLARID